MAATTTPKHWTAADLRALPDDGKRYEIIDGELFVSPSPMPVHQRLVGRLLLLLDSYVRDHQLGEALASPADIELADDTVVSPMSSSLHSQRKRLPNVGKTSARWFWP